MKKIFRQNNSWFLYLVKLLLSRNFCQKCVRLNRSDFHTTVWKLRNFTAIVFSQIFRQINVLQKNFHSKLIWRKKICVVVNFSFFHNCTKNISWNQLLSNFFIKTVAFTKLWPQNVRENLQNFDTVHTVFPQFTHCELRTSVL